MAHFKKFPFCKWKLFQNGYCDASSGVYRAELTALSVCDNWKERGGVKEMNITYYKMYK
jgi:hypothetical protein